MNILLIDKGGYFLDFALRCLDAGHDVRWFLGAMKGGFRNPQGDGLGVKKVPAWEPSMRWADIILIPDNSVYMEQLEVWRRRGFPIWGPNCETAAWELCRRKGQEIISSIGAKTIPSYTFGKIDDAIRFLKANPRRYVSKLDDDNDTKAMSYVAKSPRDLLFMLEKWKRQHAMKVDFVLQDFVPGVEMAVGGWFGPAGFSEWWCENWEHKKLMSGEIGPNTGEMGTVLRYTEDSPLAERLLRPLEGHLYRAGFTGYIDVAVIVGGNGTPYPLEFTTRPGWPLFEIQQAVHPEPVEWMKNALDGRWTFKPHTDVVTGVVVALPDFPYCSWPHEKKCGYPLYGADRISRRHFHPTQVMMGEAPNADLRPEPILVSAGDCVATITGYGDSVCEASEAAYANVKKLELPNSPLYRDDIGEKLKDILPRLKEHDLVRGVKYD